jgi:hypothetical protein
MRILTRPTSRPGGRCYLLGGTQSLDVRAIPTPRGGVLASAGFTPLMGRDQPVQTAGHENGDEQHCGNGNLHAGLFKSQSTSKSQ